MNHVDLNGGAAQVPPLLGRFTCPFCPSARFESVGDKKRHLRDTHPKENR